MEQLIEQFLEHLRYERNVSTHTLRNYSSDLEQFLDYLAPAKTETGERNTPELTAIDHLTIREWIASLHSAQKKKASIARKLATLRTFFQFLVREGVLELNPANAAVKGLLTLPEGKLETHARLLYDLAVIGEGSRVKDPAALARRVGELLARDGG